MAMTVSLLLLALSAWYALAFPSGPASADGSVHLGVYGPGYVDMPFPLKSPRNLGGRKWVKRDGHLCM